MARGRPRTPDAVKVLRGTFRNDRANKDAMVPELVLPEKPAGLTPAEIEAWDRVVAVLPPGVLTKADCFALELFARCYAEFLEVDQLVKDAGRMIVVRNDKGQLVSVRANPNLKHRTQLLPELRRLGEQLGLSPAARSKVNGSKEGDQPEDPFASLMGGGGISGRR